jgi:hypothetical protein
VTAYLGKGNPLARSRFQDGGEWGDCIENGAKMDEPQGRQTESRKQGTNVRVGAEGGTMVLYYRWMDGWMDG